MLISKEETVSCDAYYLNSQYVAGEENTSRALRVVQNICKRKGQFPSEILRESLQTLDR